MKGYGDLSLNATYQFPLRLKHGDMHTAFFMYRVCLSSVATARHSSFASHSLTISATGRRPDNVPTPPTPSSYTICLRPYLSAKAHMPFPISTFCSSEMCVPERHVSVAWLYPDRLKSHDGGNAAEGDNAVADSLTTGSGGGGDDGSGGGGD